MKKLATLIESAVYEPKCMFGPLITKRGMHENFLGIVLHLDIVLYTQLRCNMFHHSLLLDISIGTGF